MRAKTASFFRHPRWVVALVIAIAVAFWSIPSYSIADQIGHPLPDFFRTQSVGLFLICGHLSPFFLSVAIGTFVHLLPTG